MVLGGVGNLLAADHGVKELGHVNARRHCGEHVRVVGRGQRNRDAGPPQRGQVLPRTGSELHARLVEGMPQAVPLVADVGRRLVQSVGLANPLGAGRKAKGRQRLVRQGVVLNAALPKEDAVDLLPEALGRGQRAVKVKDRGAKRRWPERLRTVPLCIKPCISRETHGLRGS